MFSTTYGVPVQCRLKVVTKRHKHNSDGFKCNYENCPRVFKSLNALKQHRKLHISISGHRCSKCGTAYKRRSDFLQHTCLEKPPEVNDGISPLRYKCDQCDLSFQTNKLCERHISFYCVKSQKSTSNISDEIIEPATPKFPCDIPVQTLIQQDWFEEDEIPAEDNNEWVEIIELKDEDLDEDYVEPAVTIKTEIKEEPTDLECLSAGVILPEIKTELPEVELEEYKFSTCNYSTLTTPAISIKEESLEAEIGPCKIELVTDHQGNTFSISSTNHNSHSRTMDAGKSNFT